LVADVSEEVLAADFLLEVVVKVPQVALAFRQLPHGVNAQVVVVVDQQPNHFFEVDVVLPDGLGAGVL